MSNKRVQQMESNKISVNCIELTLNFLNFLIFLNFNSDYEIEGGTLEECERRQLSNEECDELLYRRYKEWVMTNLKPLRPPQTNDVAEWWHRRSRKSLAVDEVGERWHATPGELGGGQ